MKLGTLHRVLVFLITAATAATAAADPARTVAAKRGIEAALQHSGPEALIRARGEFEALSAASPKSAMLHYWVAYADWRLTPRMSKDEKQAERFCRDGIRHADKALELDPGFAEALALKAALQGMSLRFDPGATMSLGAEMEESFARAKAQAPRNPRVLFLDGLNTLHKPEFVGGGAKNALATLEKAQGLFAAETVADSTAPDWGHDDACAWAGRSAMKLGDFEAALRFYEKALEVNPRNTWVRHVLMPELEKARAERKDKKGKKGES